MVLLKNKDTLNYLLLLLVLFFLLSFSSAYASDYQETIEQAFNYLNQGDYQNALLSFQLAYELNPDSQDVMLGIAKLHAIETNSTNIRYTEKSETTIISRSRNYPIRSRGVDSEKPNIDLSTISTDKEIATVGDTIKVSIKITDNINVERAYIYFYNIDSGNLISFHNLVYNINNDRWEYEFIVNSNIPNGQWVISDIIAYDSINNVDLKTPYTNIFTIYGAAENIQPEINLASIITSKEIATVGDEITVSVKLSDNVKVTRAYIYFLNEEAFNLKSFNELKYNSYTDMWEYTFKVTSMIPNGIWKVSDLIAYDSVNNVNIQFTRTNLFTVYGAAEAEKPFIDLNSILVSQEKASVGDIINISIKITDNVGVTEAFIYLKNKNTDKLLSFLSMAYNSETDRWEYNFEVNNMTPDGDWIITDIIAYDAIRNGCFTTPFCDAFTTNYYFDFKNQADIILPSSLKIISEEAFYNCDFSSVMLPNTCEIIMARAFSTSSNILRIYIPATVETIDDYAFEGCNKVIIYSDCDSYAIQYAKQKHYMFVIYE